MADTIHKVGEGMYVLMCVLFFYLHVWCAAPPNLGYTQPRSHPTWLAAPNRRVLYQFGRSRGWW